MKNKYQDDPYFSEISPLNPTRPDSRELPKPIGFVRPAAYTYSPGPMTRQRSIKIEYGRDQDIPISPLNRIISPLINNENSPFRRTIMRQQSNLIDQDNLVLPAPKIEGIEYLRE